MKAKEIFLLVVRLIGLIGTIYLARGLYHGAGSFVHHPSFLGLFHLVFKSVFLLIALYLIRGAPILMRFAFAEDYDPAPHHPAPSEPTDTLVK